MVLCFWGQVLVCGAGFMCWTVMYSIYVTVTKDVVQVIAFVSLYDRAEFEDGNKVEEELTVYGKDMSLKAFLKIGKEDLLLDKVAKRRINPFRGAVIRHVDPRY